MTIFKQVMLNGTTLREFPFQREFELQGYLLAHPELLSLVEGNEDFKVRDVIGVERTLKQGRVDLIVEYCSGKIAIVELKKGEVERDDYEQVKRYLNDVSTIKGWKALQDLKQQGWDFDELVSERNLFGVLVGRSFSEDVFELLQKSTKPIINGLTIKRYKTEDNEYLMTEAIANFNKKDYQKYLVNGRGPFGKGRMVLAAIQEYVLKNRNVSYDDLSSEKLFPATLRGTKGRWGCVSPFNEAKNLAEETGYKRHFLDTEDVITLNDGSKVAVSSQWGIGNVDEFIRRVESFGIEITRLDGVHGRTGRKLLQ
jgi:hypothetical protein